MDQALKHGHTWVVDADLQSNSHMIPKEPLLDRFKEHVGNRRVLERL